MKRLIHISILAWLTLSASAQSFVTGTVYEDNNHNHRRDGKEKGIAGVALSNGVDVTLTNASGAYRLPATDDFTVFVIKPEGYQATLDAFNLPQSYYIHKPAGSPDSFYPGTKPTGKLPAAVDFALHPTEEPDTFTVLLYGDTQPYDEQELEYLKRGIVAETQTLRGLAFGITLGDLVGDRLDLHLPYKQAIAQLGIPWYNVMGNHDMNYDAREDRLSDESFEAQFGPNNYAFNYGKAHFIILDDILYPHPLTGRGYWGGLRPDQLAFLRNDLAHVPPDRLVVISMHIPLIDSEGEEAFRDADRQAIYKVLADHPHVLFLSAHTHLQLQHRIGREQGVDRDRPIHEYNVGATCGDWFSGPLDDRGLPTSTMRDGTPAGYAFLRIEGKDRYLLDYKAVGQPADHQLSLYHPQVVPAGRSTTAYLYANFFMGSPADTLESRVDDGPWVQMRRVEEFDPAYYRYVQDWDYRDHLIPGRRPSHPVVCTHLWRSRMPTPPSVGQHRLEVRARDRFGRTHTAVSSYRTEESP